MKTRYFLSMVLGLALAGCGGINGKLTVKEAFQLKDRKGQTHAIPVGTHKVNLQYKESKNRLTVTFDKLNGEEAVIEAKTPEGFSIPENGSFSLKAADYGQEVDLNGTVTTTQEDTPEYWGRQSCQYTTWETVCVTNPQGQTSCSQRPISRPGYQDIRYYDVVTEQTLSAEFSNPATSAAVANINAHSSYSQRRVTYQGICGW